MFLSVIIPLNKAPGRLLRQGHNWLVIAGCLSSNADTTPEGVRAFYLIGAMQILSLRDKANSNHKK